MAILYGALMIHGLQSGPLLMKDHPDFFWGVVISMYIGNAMLLVLNLPLIPLWVKVLKIPYPVLFPLIVLFCLVGAYSLNNSPADVLIMTAFGVVGYFMKKFNYEAAPMIMAFVLWPILELNLRRSLVMSDGSFSIFFTRGISVGILIFAAGLLVISLMSNLRKIKPETEEVV
jgi:putative tricarboxylic transport membrane protein